MIFSCSNRLCPSFIRKLCAWSYPSSERLTNLLIKKTLYKFLSPLFFGFLPTPLMTSLSSEISSYVQDTVESKFILIDIYIHFISSIFYSLIVSFCRKLLTSYLIFLKIFFQLFAWSSQLFIPIIKTVNIALYHI